MSLVFLEGAKTYQTQGQQERWPRRRHVTRSSNARLLSYFTGYYHPSRRSLTSFAGGSGKGRGGYEVHKYHATEVFDIIASCRPPLFHMF